MFEILKLRWEIRSIQRFYARERKKLHGKKASREEFEQLESSQYAEQQDVETRIEKIESGRLLWEAWRLDVETPPISDEGMWYREFGGRAIWLTPKGRAHVRRLIDEEKARRFDVKTRWVVKIILPVVGSLIGIIGAITGLVAVLQHRK